MRNNIDHIISEPWTRKIGEVLKKHAGARDSDLTGMPSYLGECARDSEYRFCGELGFGGKFRHRAERWSVDCYRENENPARLEMIRWTNVALKNLREEFLRAHPVFCLSMSAEDFEKALRVIHQKVKDLLAPYGERFSPWVLRNLEGRLKQLLEEGIGKRMFGFAQSLSEPMGGALFDRREEGIVKIYSRTMFLWIRLLFAQNGATLTWVDNFEW